MNAIEIDPCNFQTDTLKKYHEWPLRTLAIVLERVGEW